MRALIVDDNEDMRSLLRLTMELAGIDVAAEAADAAECVRHWQEHEPDVIILDQRMPGPTGLDAAEYILRHDPATLILLFSAYLDPEAMARARRLGIRTVGKDRVRDLPSLIGVDAA